MTSELSYKTVCKLDWIWGIATVQPSVTARASEGTKMALRRLNMPSELSYKTVCKLDWICGNATV